MCVFFHFKTDKYLTAKGLPFVVIQSQLEHNPKLFKEALRIIRKEATILAITVSFRVFLFKAVYFRGQELGWHSEAFTL